MAKVFLLLTLLSVVAISTIAFAQTTDTEEITLSTYYPAPYGEYDSLFSEKLLVWRPDAAEMADMNEGDCHIGWSLVVGAGGTGFSYDELQFSGNLPQDGDVLIKGFVGIGTTDPSAALDVVGSLQIPNETDPTTDEEGEIAYDTNADAIEVYDGSASRLIPSLQSLHKTIWDPDGIQSTLDAIPLMRVEPSWAPHGITIVDIYMAADAANSGTYALEEWSSPTTPASTIESCAFSASTQFTDDGTLADPFVAAGSYVFINLDDTTDLNFLQVTFTYYINEGD